MKSLHPRANRVSRLLCCACPYRSNLADRGPYLVEFADLAVLDFSKLGDPAGEAELVAKARDAMREIGFFAIINHGLTPEKFGPHIFSALRLLNGYLATASKNGGYRRRGFHEGRRCREAEI